jgi:hypothetical protein
LDSSTPDSDGVEKEVAPATHEAKKAPVTISKKPN